MAMAGRPVIFERRGRGWGYFERRKVYTLKTNPLFERSNLVLYSILPQSWLLPGFAKKQHLYLT